MLKEETYQQEERIEGLRKRVYCQKEYMIAAIRKASSDYLKFNIGLDGELLENSIAAQGNDCRCRKSPKNSEGHKTDTFVFYQRDSEFCIA